MVRRAGRHERGITLRNETRRLNGTTRLNGTARSRWNRATRYARRPHAQVAVVAALVLPLAAVVLFSGGAPAQRLPLTGGAVWLASPGQGLLTLLDGPSEQVVGSVRVAGAVAGDALS